MLDLAKPEWKGRWGASPSGRRLPGHRLGLLQLKGDGRPTQWLTGMKANAKVYNGNIATMKAVNAGEVDGGIIYHYYWFGDQAKTNENGNNVALASTSGTGSRRVRQPVRRRRAEVVEASARKQPRPS